MRTTVNIQDSNKIAKEKNNDRRIKRNLKNGPFSGNDDNIGNQKINDKSNDKLQ